MIDAKQHAAFVLLGILVFFCGLPARAQEPVIHGRSFDRFQFDPVVNRGLWGEGRITYAHEESDRFGGDKPHGE